MKHLVIMLAAILMLCACQNDADYTAPSNQTFSALSQGSNAPSPVPAESFTMVGLAAVSYANLLVSADFDWLRTQTAYQAGGDYDHQTTLHTESQGAGVCAKLTLQTNQAYSNIQLCKFRLTLGGNTYDYDHHTGIYDTAAHRWIATPAIPFNRSVSLQANRTYEVYIVGGVNTYGQGQFLDAGECQPTPYLYATPLGHAGQGWFYIDNCW